MKSKNHDISHDVMASYMKVVLKNWEGFTHFSFTMLTNQSISEEDLKR
jgi:hypothetical protein